LRGESFDRVIVMGPSHQVPFRGVAVADVRAFETPLGLVPLIPEADALGRTSPFLLQNAPHAREHSIEVQLPFLQRVLREFTLLPLVFGAVDERIVAEALDPLVGSSTLLIASSDLSHYRPYDQAVKIDRETLRAILDFDTDAVSKAEACGRSPLTALLHLARARSWQAQLLSYKNSGDTAGDRSRVVGYAAIAFFEPTAA
jgi:AmmeMemoRadiSam system protein B